MSNLWLRIKIWFKVTLVVAVFVYVACFTIQNASEEVRFWYWHNHQPETNLLLLVLCAFGAGILASLLIRTTYRTMKQINDLQHRSRVNRIDRQIADIHSKAAMLQTKPAPTDAAIESEIHDEGV